MGWQVNGSEVSYTTPSLFIVFQLLFLEDNKGLLSFFFLSVTEKYINDNGE